MTERRLQVLVPIVRARTAPRLLEVAAAIVRAEGGSGQLLGVVELPPGRPIAQNVTVARRYRALLQRLTDLGNLVADNFRVQVRVASTVAQGVREAAYENATGVVVLEWPGPGTHRAWVHIEDLVADPPADLLLVRPDPDGIGPGRGVLVPIRGGASARLAVRIAAALASAHRAVVTALHVYDPRHPAERREREARQFRELLHDFGRLRVRVVEVESANPSRVIAEEGGRHGATVLGAYAATTRSPVLVGSALARTVQKLPGTVILAKSPRAVPPILADGPVTAPVVVSGPEISAIVDKWFAENTFHSREFRDVGRLVELKRRQGLTISLGLPTLNEESTIGNVIQTLKGELMDRVPLIDEVVVVDSGSTDRTAEIAGALGVPVVRHAEVLPEHGTFQGKGEALWKSLHVLRGDIVVWCDTDISNIHPQFVYGTVGPLLTDPRISYVKGFYRRPLNFGGELQAAGGGRVTELVARPIFNLFYPLLSGLVQPLSGEYAGRRDLLERLPFFTGYGVETGHLIDIVENFGLNCIAQTDLGVRIHRNQDLFALSRMAFAIMQVALRRLGDRHRIYLLEEVNRSMKLIHYHNDRFFLEVKEIGDWERPPMGAIPEYALLHRHRRTSD
ncbi:MAG TPA: glucosyl-3-phosphoglycerate synthase [Candidatus Dormibacteraeota bacterium]|nr:glucosyl-3-phosphoglycerate synthase [Candidatus Dormibacteraeota bacterium]